MWGVFFYCLSVAFTELSLLGQGRSVSSACVREAGEIPGGVKHLLL